MFWTDDDIFLFNQGTNYCTFEHMGAHSVQSGIRFSVWVPGASAVFVTGSFNGWDPYEYALSPISDSGIWTADVSAASVGDLYKYVIVTDNGETLYKADPYAFSSEMRPGTASRIADVDHFVWNDGEWIAKRSCADHFRMPMNIYEVHAGSWKVHEDGSFLTYRELADELVPYVSVMGYTHIELMPLSEHPFDGSWGYQVTGYFAPTSRYGSPDDLMYLIDKCHSAGIGVIMDWVPGHFCRDAHGLGRMNGHKLYEIKEHVHWGTYIFDYGREQVRSFLLSNAYYWLDRYHIDGIRVDGVSSMLYLNYGIDDPKEKQFNKNGGEENLEAISLLQEFNRMVGENFPGVFTVAEESSAWPLVTYPPEKGGLGFHYKWDMGWMNDTLRYFSTDCYFRKYEHNLLSFSMMYAFSENFILPLSHDEVVHGKKSLIGRMPGSYSDQFRELKLLAMYQMCHTGAKLNFMGNEIAQFIEWRFYEGIEWFLLGYDNHRMHQEFIRSLNMFYRNEPALWKDDSDWDGFSWIDADNGEQSVLSFYRTDPDSVSRIVCVLNLAPVDYPEYELGMPDNGIYREILSTDQTEFGGEGRLNPKDLKTDGKPRHGCGQSMTFRLPPLTGILFRCTKKIKQNRKGKTDTV